jgi:hypothetical protein
MEFSSDVDGRGDRAIGEASARAPGNAHLRRTDRANASPMRRKLELPSFDKLRTTKKPHPELAVLRQAQDEEKTLTLSLSKGELVEG